MPPDFNFSQTRSLANEAAQLQAQREFFLQGQRDAQLGLDRKQQDRDRFEAGRQFDASNQNDLNDFGFQEDQFAEDTRRFDVGQQNRTALLEQLGLATPGGPSSEFGGEGTLFDNLLNGSTGGGQAFTDLLSEQRGARDSALSDITSFGDSQRAALGRTFDTAENNITSNLEGRGLGASNLVGSGLSQVAAERGQANLELEDQLLGRRTDLANNLNAGIFDTQTGQLDRDNQRQLQGISTIGQLTSGLV